MHSPNNRYVEDDKTAQAVAQFWSRIGIDARVEVMPSNVFFTRAGRREFSAFLIGFGHTTGDAWLGMSQVLYTYDPQRGLGGLNRTRYSNPAFDAVMDARGRVDPEARGALLRHAQDIAVRTPPSCRCTCPTMSGRTVPPSPIAAAHRGKHAGAPPPPRN